MSGRLGSLFSGAAGLDMAVCSVLDVDPVWHAEVDPAAARVLAHRFPKVPNLGDVTAVDWASVEPVDVLCGGSPCQDVSHAGKRAGMRVGTRSGLWASMCDAIATLRPQLVVWENVRGVLSAEADSALEPCAGCVGDGDDGPVLRALGRVLGDLAELGYDAGWCGLRAADVGAPHGRFRVFVVAADAGVGQQPRAAAVGHGLRVVAERSDRTTADAERERGERWGGHGDLAGSTRAGEGEGHQRQRHGDAADDRGTAAANSACSGGPDEPFGGDEAGQHVGAVASAGDRVGAGRAAEGVHELGRTAGVVDWGQYEPAIRRWERVLGRPAPSPTEVGPKGGQRLSPRLTEWMMGWPAGWVTDVPGVSRNDALKICGNGCVPQQVEWALRHLLGVHDENLQAVRDAV